MDRCSSVFDESFFHSIEQNLCAHTLAYVEYLTDEDWLWPDVDLRFYSNDHSILGRKMQALHIIVFNTLNLQ